MIKTPGMTEKLAREKTAYLAFITSAICERALDGNLIYSGRAGHLLLPGVTHRLRVGAHRYPWKSRVEESHERQTEHFRGQGLGLPGPVWMRTSDKWIRSIHKTDRREPDQYDFLFVNLQNMGVGNAASRSSVKWPNSRISGPLRPV